MRTSLRFRPRAAGAVVSVYEYLKATCPLAVASLEQAGLFDESLFLAPGQARYLPAGEALTAADLRWLMAAPGEDKRRGGVE